MSTWLFVFFLRLGVQRCPERIFTVSFHVCYKFDDDYNLLQGQELTDDGTAANNRKKILYFDSAVYCSICNGTLMQPS